MTFTDLTPTFRQVVTGLESRRVPGEAPLPERDKARILRTRTGRDPFERRARDIAGSVAQLKEFLLENRKAYLDLGHLNLDTDAIGDLQRDKIDAGANVFIRTCNGLISQFKKDLSASKDLGETRLRHLEAVSNILESFLKAACEIYAGQKAIRIQKELEVQKLSRLEVNARKLEDQTQHQDYLDQSSDENEEEELSAEVEARRREKQAQSQVYLEQSSDDDEPLSPEELQLLEAENVRMYEDFQSVQDSVQQIENKVVKIAELQEIFTEKILQQKDDIDLIALNAVASTENVKDGNEELRKAIQNQASIRVYILFFLLVMSFSLLFLDWYND